MTNNDILRRIRFALELNDAQMVAVFAQSQVTLSEAEVVAYMAKEHEANVKVCSGTLLAQFLDGLILENRGPRKEGAPVAPPVEELTNNGVFKKLRIALSMQEKEVLAALAAGGQKLSKGELSALFRNPSHKHYRACGDQILRNFLNGLTRLRRSPKPRQDSESKAKRKATDTPDPWGKKK